MGEWTVSCAGTSTASVIGWVCTGTTCSNYSGLTWQAFTTGGGYERRAAMRSMADRNYQCEEELGPAKKALELLDSLLNDIQRAELDKNGWFEMIGANGKRYRLYYHRHGNVVRFGESGAIEAAWCGHLGLDLPIGDTLAGQFLMLSASPGDYEDQANIVSKSDFDICREMVGAPKRISEARAA